MNPVLVPVMNAMLNEYKGFADCRLPFREANTVGRGGSPWINGAVDEGYTRIAKVEAAKLVDGFDIWGRCDVEAFAAVDCRVL